MRGVRRLSAGAAALALAAGLVALLPVTAQAHDGHGDHADVGAAAPENSVVAAAQSAVAADSDALSQAATLPPGFADVEVIGHMSEAIAVAFAPDGTAFIALKTGVIKSYDYNAGTGQFEPFGTSSQFADLSAEVDNYWDRGLTGIAVDPQFGTAGHNYVYVNYTYNRDPRDNPPVVPKWGDPSQQYDDCPAPADETDPTVAGCVVMDRVTRLTAQRVAGPPSGWEMVPGTEKELLASGCFQFGSHASGDVAFGPDGMLYASAGEGGSFDSLDYGQYANPCNDPVDEGGSLRSQDYRTSGANDPLGVDGTIVRMDPATGLVPTQASANQWLVAYGQRNPWRLSFRPGTKELWSRDVGASLWEEVNRIPDVTAVSTPINRGWPCYEGSFTGSLKQPGWDALDKPLCESLYAQGPSAVSAPYFSYQTRGDKLTGSDEDCLNSTSAGSGVAFAAQSSNYPAAYKDAMFFSDFARSCVWVLGKKPDGQPDPTNIQRFVQHAATPVDLVTGPGGDIYYVDYGLDDNGAVTENAAGVHRIVYTGANATPTATIVADKTSGPAPLTVTFDGTTSTDPDGDTLTYAWDLDGDGQYDDSVAAKPSKSYTVGTYNIGLQVNDGHGHSSTATQQIQAGNSPPVIGTVLPADTLTWAAGDTINFSGSATDPQDGTLPASAFSWNVAIRHCPGDVCHTHNLQTYPGVYSGSLTAPAHEYPSHLLLTLTVTDSGGLTTSKTIQLDPKIVTLSFASAPTGAMVTVGSADHATPYAETFIQNAPTTVTAAPTTGTGATIAAFSSWSDGGARSHAVTPPSAATTYTATYTRPTATLTANPTSGTAPLTVTYTAGATNAPGATGAFTYAWDLDDDGQYDDGAGATQTRTYSAVSSPVVRVLATDSRGATDAKSVTVTVGNAAPTARITTSPSPASGVAPLQVSFDARTSTDPNTGDTLTYAWDLDGNGTFETPGATPSRSYGVGTVTVTLRATDSHGSSSTATVPVTASNSAPTITSMTPAAGTTWSVGQSLSLAATATDPQETLTDAAYSWKIERQDCDTGCPRSTVVTLLNQRTATFTVPELPYPSHLFVSVTVTDGQGQTTALTRQLDPRTVPLTFTTAPAAGTVTVAGVDHVAPWTQTFVQGAQVALSVPASRTVGGASYDFSSWSDAGSRAHAVTAPAAATTYTATYTAVTANTAPTVARVSTYPEGSWYVGQTLGFDAAATDPEQALPDSAYSFVMERQDCDTGCPRVVVQRWAGVSTGQFVVPPMPYPSHLYLTATATDDHGATGARTIRIDPGRAALTVQTKHKKLSVSVDGVDRKDGWSGLMVVGSTVRLVAPRHQVRHGVRYVFAKWSDGGARVHDVRVWDAQLTVKAVYRRVR